VMFENVKVGDCVDLLPPPCFPARYQDWRSCPVTRVMKTLFEVETRTMHGLIRFSKKTGRQVGRPWLADTWMVRLPNQGGG